MTQHVFVETNWVVEIAAPKYRRGLQASDLLDRANSAQIKLYLPNICLTEARFVIQRKYQPRNDADAMRGFLAWAKSEGQIQDEEKRNIERVLNQFEQHVKNEIRALDQTFATLQSRPNEIEIFAMDEQILERAVQLAASDIYLKPFDQAILAAVLVRAERLHSAGHHDVSFCERDGDLQCWDKHGNAKPQLKELYDTAGVWVYGDFQMHYPSRPRDWPP